MRYSYLLALCLRRWFWTCFDGVFAFDYRFISFVNTTKVFPFFLTFDEMRDPLGLEARIVYSHKVPSTNCHNGWKKARRTDVMRCARRVVAFHMMLQREKRRMSVGRMRMSVSVRPTIKMCVCARARMCMYVCMWICARTHLCMTFLAIFLRLSADMR